MFDGFDSAKQEI